MPSKTNFAKFFGNSKHILFIEIVVYSVFFSYATVSKYLAFQTYAYDLGVYNQVLHSTLFDGKFLYATPDLLANPTGCLFGIHFSPIFLAILPIYAIYPNPPTLLVLQSTILSLGALPLYLLASSKLSSEKWGLFFASLYLLNPALQGINWYDFHPEAFLPTLFLFALYFLDNKKTVGYIASFSLALMSIEFAPAVFIFISLYLLIKMKPWKKQLIDKRRMQLVLLTFLISLVWLFLSLQIIHFFNPLVRPMTGEVYWREIGANSILDVPAQVFFHPGRVINALLFDGWEKLGYVLVLFGSVAFLPVIEPLIVISIFPWLATALLSNFAPFYQFGDQYPSYIIALIFYGAILGVQKLQFWSSNILSRKKMRMTAGIIFVLSVIFCYISSPLNSKPYASSDYFSYGLPEITQHDRNILKLLELLPPTASVLTQMEIFPLVSNRANAYLFPSDVHYPPGKSIEDALYDLLGKVDYVILDFETNRISAPMMLWYANSNGHFGLYASIDGSLILRRDYSQMLASFKPIENTYDHESLVLANGTIVRDSDSENGYAFLHSESNNYEDFWYGPYVFLPPGRYQATFSLKLNNPSEGELINIYLSEALYNVSIEYVGSNTTGYNLGFRLMVSDGNSAVEALNLSESDFSVRNQYSNFTIDFTVDDFGIYEFRGSTPPSESNILISEVHLAQIEAFLNFRLQFHEEFQK